MSNSTSNLVLIQTAQAQKELTANALFTAASPATAYGRIEQQSNGFTWAYYGATLPIAGVPTQIPNGTLTLTASTVVYIEARVDTGAVTQNNLGWTPGRLPLYKVTVGASGPTSWIDMRYAWRTIKQAATVAVTGDVAFQSAESSCDIVTFTGSPSASFNVTIPAVPAIFVAINATGQDAVFSTGTSETFTVAAGKSLIVICDGVHARGLSA